MDAPHPHLPPYLSDMPFGNEDGRTILKKFTISPFFPKADLGCGCLCQLLVTLCVFKSSYVLPGTTRSQNELPILHLTLKPISSPSPNNKEANLPSTLISSLTSQEWPQTVSKLEHSFTHHPLSKIHLLYHVVSNHGLGSLIFFFLFPPSDQLLCSIQYLALDFTYFYSGHQM